MKKTYITILISVLFISCKVDKKIKFYPSETYFNKQRLIPINGLSFEEIVKQYNWFDFHKKDTMCFFNLVTKKNIKKIVLSPKSTGYKKGKNLLRIEKDSIFVGYYKSFKVDDLPYLLKKFYLNYGKENWLSDSPQKAAIMIEPSVYENKRDLEIILKKLTTDFDSLNATTEEELELYIILATPLPPPPPPSGGVKKDN